MKARTLRTLSLLGTLILFAIAFPRLAAADLASLVAQAARYESGGDVVPLRQFEALLRDSAAQPDLRRDLESALVQLLAPAATFEAKRFACQHLAIVGTEASLAALAETLRNEETVGIACLALGSYPTPKANETLRAALASARGMARAQIINTLGNRLDTEAVPALRASVTATEPEVVDAAMAALGRIANAEALQALAQWRSSGPSVSLAEQASLVAAEQVSSRDPQSAQAIYHDLLGAPRPAYVRRAAFEGLLRLDPDDGVKRMLAALNGSDATLQPSAIARIPRLKSSDPINRLAKSMPKLASAEQVLMIEALAARNDPAARKAITAHISASDPAVRRATIAALGQVGDASTVPVLSKALLPAADAPERQTIETALVRLKGGAAVDQALAATLRSRMAVHRPSLISALGRRGNRVAIPTLLAEAGSPDPATATAAFQALGKMATADDLDALLKAVTGLKAPAAREAAENATAQALAKTPSENRRTEAVRAALTRVTDPETHLSLIRLLASCGGPQALETLNQARQDADATVRDTATRTLADWPDLLAWDALLNLYQKSDDAALRVLSLRALTRLAAEANARPDTAQVERYRVLLADAKSDNDRKLILSALAGCAHPEALALALPLASQPTLKAEAELAMKKIAEAIKDKHPDAARDALQKLK